MRLYTLFLLVLVLAGCGDTPPSLGSPLRPSRPVDAAPLRISCTPEPPSLRCTASVFGTGNVTSQTKWWASEIYVFTTESSGVVFFAPGIVTAVRSTNIYVRGEYRNSGGGVLRAVAPHSYEMTPGGAPVPLAYVSGQVNVPGLGGATVEVIDGEGTGKRDLTRDNGFYMIEHMKLGVPFTLRASRDGYASESKTNSGIVDDVFGVPANNTVNFTLLTIARAGPE